MSHGVSNQTLVVRCFTRLQVKRKFIPDGPYPQSMPDLDDEIWVLLGLYLDDISVLELEQEWIKMCGDAGTGCMYLACGTDMHFQEPEGGGLQWLE